MSTDSANHKQRPVAPLGWLLALLALVPIAGIIFGLIAVEWGMRTRDSGGRPLVRVAALTLAMGVAITIGGYAYRADIFGIGTDPGDLRLEVPLTPAASGN